jgi:co-chaperonin GroES (HSP10)
MSEEDLSGAKQLPEPKGWHILCALPELEKEYQGGLIKADVTIKNEKTLTTVLYVIKLGADAYQDKTKFPNGSWCAEGDFIIVRPNTGTRVIIHGKEFRLINDDCVEAVVEDPRGINRGL